MTDGRKGKGDMVGSRRSQLGVWFVVRDDVKLDCPIEGESGSLFGKARASGLIEARGESPSALRNRSFNQTEEQFRRTGWRNASA
jgi:hypothetical protein